MPKVDISQGFLSLNRIEKLYAYHIPPEHGRGFAKYAIKIFCAKVPRLQICKEIGK